MPSVYDHLHSIVSGGLVKALDLMPHSGDVEEGGVRSLCGGTLDAKISELDRATASFDIQMLEGRGDISKAFFKRDRSDVGKLKALKAVANRLKENGCIISRLSPPSDLLSREAAMRGASLSPWRIHL